MTARIPLKASHAAVSFVVHCGDGQVTRSYRQLFATGYKHWRLHAYDKAQYIFQCLASAADQGPRAHILLAHCQAMRNEFGQCSATLSEALANRRSNKASIHLHEAFVFWRVGLWDDVIRILQKVITEHPELPTPCLLMGEVLSQMGRRDQSLQCLRRAIRVDRRDGVIGFIARREVAAELHRGSLAKSDRASNKIKGRNH